MVAGKIYLSNSTKRGKADFFSIPFHSASINWNREEASTMTFKSPRKYPEGARIRYIRTGGNNFGGQIYKVQKGTGEDYTYNVISYLRLYHDKVTCNFSNLTSSEIMKKVLRLSKNDFSTSGITDTEIIHQNLKWENTSIWEIALQLCWLEHQAGYEVRCRVNADSILEFGYIPYDQEGYIFDTAIDYEEEHDSSDLITLATVTFNGQTLASASSDNDIIARWGYVGEVTECPANTVTSTGATSTVTATSLRDNAQIRTYGIPEEIVTQALSLCKAGDTPYNNLKRLYEWADTKIGYEYYNNTRHGASGTFKRRKGNCCDNTHVMIALARSIGIKSRYCHAKSNGKGHVYGEYYVNNKWFVVDTGVTSTGRYWGSHSNYAGGTSARYEKLPF